MVGVNGAGKTTSAAKLAQPVRSIEDKKVLLAARPTPSERPPSTSSRSGAGGLDLDVIAHQPGSDAGRGSIRRRGGRPLRGATDVVIVDTAGRLHYEVQPHGGDQEDPAGSSRGTTSPPRSQTIVLALDATTGQNGLIAGPGLHRGATGATASFSSKLDSSAKGGIVYRDSVRAEVSPCSS